MWLKKEEIGDWMLRTQSQIKESNQRNDGLLPSPSLQLLKVKKCRRGKYIWNLNLILWTKVLLQDSKSRQLNVKH